MDTIECQVVLEVCDGDESSHNNVEELRINTLKNKSQTLLEALLNEKSNLKPKAVYCIKRL